MTNLDFFDDRGRVLCSMDEQVQNLERVSSRIAPIIRKFFREHAGQEFHMETLRRAVEEVVDHLAPDSPGRVMRDLRDRKEINYELVSRRASLYRVLA